MEPQATPQPQIPPTPQIKNSLVLIMSILLIITVAIAGLFYFQIQKLSKQLAEMQVQVQPTPLVSPKPSAEAETANWKTYTNSQYGYSVKYYPPLSPTKEISDDIYLSFVGFENPSLQDKPYLQQEAFSISVRKTELDKEVEYHKWTVEGHVLASLDKEENINFQGYKGVRLEYKPDSEGVDPFTIVVINNGKYSYAIKSIPERIDQILSTFKFVDSTKTSLIPADSQTPVAGICRLVQGPGASITLNIDTPSPRCTEVSANQKLTLINGTNQTISLKYNKYESQILPGSSYTFPQTVGLFLAPGAHIITTSLYGGGGPEVWLR